jgi:hypothetical protein
MDRVWDAYFDFEASHHDNDSYRDRLRELSERRHAALSPKTSVAEVSNQDFLSNPVF